MLASKIQFANRTQDDRNSWSFDDSIPPGILVPTHEEDEETESLILDVIGTIYSDLFRHAYFGSAFVHRALEQTILRLSPRRSGHWRPG